MAEPPAIQLNKLSKRYSNRVLALDGIDLEIEHGRVVGYLGPNGAGKTTTMKILSNIIRPTSGSAIINGIDIQKHPTTALKKVGFLLEVPGMYEYLTPVEMMTYSASIYGLEKSVIRSRINEMLEVVMLSEWAEKKIGSFSTGMIRRLMIAMTMVHDPDIFILDEPVMGLDPKGIHDVREIIRALKNRGKTIFLSSHLLPEISETCEEVVILNRGKIVLEDRVADILERATREKAKIQVEFLSPLNQQQIEMLRGLPHIELIKFEPSMQKAEISTTGGKQGRAELLWAISNKGIPVVSFTGPSSELEDIYLSYFSAEAVT